MICPNCGFDMGDALTCARCGYKCHEIIPIDIDPDDDEVLEVPADITYVVGKVSNDPLGDIFGGLFGGIFGDIFGGLFGIDADDLYEDEDGEYDGDIYDDRAHADTSDAMVVKDIEIYDEFGNPISKPKKPIDKIKDKLKNHKRKKSDDDN